MFPWICGAVDRDDVLAILLRIILPHSAIDEPFSQAGNAADAGGSLEEIAGDHPLLPPGAADHLGAGHQSVACIMIAVNRCYACVGQELRGRAIPASGEFAWLIS